MKYPNGGRCMNCVSLMCDCSDKDFENMRPAGKPDKGGDQVVICPDFEEDSVTWREKLNAKV